MKIYPKRWTNDYLTNYFMKMSSDEIKKKLLKLKRTLQNLN